MIGPAERGQGNERRASLQQYLAAWRCINPKRRERLILRDAFAHGVMMD